MRRWLWMTGGLVIWTAHFCGLYGLASLAEVVLREKDAVWRIAALGFSAVCLGGAVLLLVLAIRRRSTGEQFPNQIAALAAAVSGVAIVWQTLPVLLLG